MPILEKRKRTTSSVSRKSTKHIKIGRKIPTDTLRPSAYVARSSKENATHHISHALDDGFNDLTPSTIASFPASTLRALWRDATGERVTSKEALIALIKKDAHKYPAQFPCFIAKSIITGDLERALDGLNQDIKNIKTGKVDEKKLNTKLAAVVTDAILLQNHPETQSDADRKEKILASTQGLKIAIDQAAIKKGTSYYKYGGGFAMALTMIAGINHAVSTIASTASSIAVDRSIQLAAYMATENVAYHTAYDAQHAVMQAAFAAEYAVMEAAYTAAESVSGTAVDTGLLTTATEGAAYLFSHVFG